MNGTRSGLLATSLLAAVIGAPAAWADMITYGATGAMHNAFGAKEITFDGVAAGTPLASYGFGDGTISGGGVAQGSASGLYAAPFGDDTPYLSVSFGSPVGLSTVSFKSPETYFGLYWGSIDAYNTITFQSGGKDVLVVPGTDMPPANGDQSSADTNRFVNFFIPGGFDRVVLASASYSFEADNLAYAAVPEPAGIAILGAGLAGLAVARRRRRR